MRSFEGWGSGLLGVIIFSASLPATKIAVEGFDPLFLTATRAVIPAVIGAVFLWLWKQQMPGRAEFVSLVVVAIGVVVGFPLFTALALEHVSSAHSIVFIGLLPITTAAFGVMRAGERHKPIFWLFSIAGAVLVAGYSLYQDGEASLIGDAYMMAAIVTCGLGYAEGAKLAKRFGGWQVICWALVLSSPVMAVLAISQLPPNFNGVSPSSWLGLAYVSLFSMLIGFVFWYRGLARGGIAAVGQLQLLQPFFGFLLAALLLGETIEPIMVGITVLVIACVVGVKRFS